MTPEERPSDDRIYAIVDSCVEAECFFVREALPVGLIGMNANTMQEQVRQVADSLLVALGLPKKYKIGACPFEWMDQISLQGKTNFFESRVTEQALAGVGNSEESRQFSLNEDF